MESIFILMGITLGIIGLGLFLPARTARTHDQVRQNWPKAKGTVMSAEVVQTQALAAKPSDSEDQFDASVKYQFRSEGQLHFGAAISHPRYLYTKDEAERIVSRYPVGNPVTVYYNPENPQESYLEIHNTAKYYRTGIAIIVAGGMVLLYGLLFASG